MTVFTKVVLYTGADGRAHTILVGPKLAVRESARRFDAHVRSRHLRSESGQALRQQRAVRYDYDPDHGTLLLRPSPS